MGKSEQFGHLKLAQKVTLLTMFHSFSSRHYSDPKIPSLPGLEEFPGRVIHSHQYRSPEDFAGKKVVVVGAGSSGVDIGIDLCGKAHRVYLSHHGNRL